ncbi:MAG: S-layer homology domain-containing protein [Eubacteriales bacterium]|nr:S-layer homology domain-containing protein [Eubacteriales bacterium]
MRAFYALALPTRKGIRDALCQSATDIGETGFDTDSGWGILNLDKALESAAEQSFPFHDVKDYDWYYDGVRFCYENGLMSGTGQKSFAPGAQTTRAMLWTILARADKQDTGGNEVWYEKAQ